jgi:hypothetical protein
MKKQKQINWMLGAVLMLAGTHVAAAAEDLNLTVYMKGAGPADLMTLAAAKATTTRIFAAIGVRIYWASGTPRNASGAALAMEFDSAAPARFRSDALAYATPFGSHTCIHIFYDRVLRTVPAKSAAGLLGHVMAHEITHVLQRNESHSETGVMKAHWTSSDYRAMSEGPLSMEQANIDAIRDYWNGTRVVASR